jgi:hypothetical protein
LAVLLISCAAGLVLGLSLFALRQGGAQQLPSPVLKEMTIHVRRGGDNDRIAPYQLLVKGQEKIPSIEPLGPKDDFKLSGEFDRPTYWYLLWIDTNGMTTIAALSEIPEARVEYPKANDMVEADPADPAGVHVLMLVAGTALSAEAVQQLERKLSERRGPGRQNPVLGNKPPAQMPTRWALVVRGPGSTNPGPAGGLDWDEYLQHIQAKMPPGVEPAYVVFLQTKK